MSDEERELRETLQARAGAMTVGRADEPGLLQRLAAARRRRGQVRLAGVAAALVVALGAASLVAAEDPDRNTLVAGPDDSTTTIVGPSTTVDTSSVETPPTLPAPAASTPTSETATSAVPGTVATTVPRTTTTKAPLAPVPDDAVWPAPGSTTTFSTEERAAMDFASRFLGMATPQVVVRNVSGNDATVDVRPNSRASLTTVLSLRRVDRRGWVVLGCAAPTIQVDQPAVGVAVASPLTVRGRAHAYEGHVDVEVRRDGATTPIGQSYGTGASDQLQPFESTVSFTRPSVPRGAVVVYEPNADDSSSGPLAATVIRVAF